MPEEVPIAVEFTEEQDQMISAQARVYGLTVEDYLKLLMLNDLAGSGRTLPAEEEKWRTATNAKRDQIDRDRSANGES